MFDKTIQMFIFDGNPNYITMFEMFTAWKEQAEKLKNGEISKEEYDRWRYNYPKL